MASPPASSPATAIPLGGNEEDGQDLSLRREENAKVPWPEQVWKAINRTVHDESMRVRVGAKFLPHRRVHPRTTSVQQDAIVNQALPGEQNSTLTISEGATIRVNEIWTEFALTTQQIHETAQAKDPKQTAAATLARRAAQYLASAQDLVIFQGANGYAAPFFTQNVRFSSQLPLDGGLLSLQDGPYAPNVQGGPYLSTHPVISVPELGTGSPPGVTYGENTFNAVAQGYSVLTAQGNPGPFALILNTVPFADLYAPVGSGSLVITADRIEPLVKAGMFGTGTLPADQSLPVSSPPIAPPGPPYYGVLVSIGGDTMDLIEGLDATTEFIQQDLN
jgi:uncharacterized linocin/CFP29 family protein